MKIAVVGTGYVGLVSGTCFAEVGNNVVCIDIDKEKVKRMQKSQIPIYEPDLEPLFKSNIKAGRLKFTDSLKKGISEAEVIFLALPTPAGEDGSADLSYVFAVAEDIAEVLDHYAVIVNKSTVPVGTAKAVKKIIGKNKKAKFDVVSNPEFLREGLAVNDFLKPDRIVVGANSAKAKKTMEELYEPFTREGAKLFIMDEVSAELTKYAANSFLATKISFMNEIANLAELTGANVDNVRIGIGADERVGSKFLYAGIGYGGSCFPKDVKALDHIASSHNYEFKIIQAVSDVNKSQKLKLISKIMNHYKTGIKGKKFALWGLAFKPDTDDIREAPALEMIEELTKAGAKIVAYDPEAMNNVKKLLADNKSLTFGKDPYSVLTGADALIIATEWSEFKTPDFGKVKKLLNAKVIFDGRNMYDLDNMKKQGFYYASIGREVVNG